MRKLWPLLGAWLVVTPISGASAAAPAPTDFAYGLAVSVPAGASLAELALPDVVYRSAVFADLRDVRVFGPRGTVAMHTFTAPVGRPNEWSARAPFYPVRGNAPAVGAAISFSASAGEAAVAVSVLADTPTEPRTVAYLVDLQSPGSKAPFAVTEVVAAWHGLQDGVPWRVTVEAGDDLSRWRTVSSTNGAVLGRFANGSDALVVDRIPITPTAARFLKLCWYGAGPTALDGVTLRLTGAPAEAQVREWEHADAFAGGEAGTFLATLGGRFPVDRLRVRLRDNRIVHLEALSRAGRDAPWIRRGGGRALRIEAGGEFVESEPLVLARTADREWKFLVPDGTAADLTSLDVEFGWVADRLQFLTQGAGTYTVAYGNAAATASEAGDRGFEASLRDALHGAAPVVVRAQVLQASTLGGPARLTNDEPGRKALLLWGVLLGGVALFGAMAVKLVREMRSAA